MVRLCSVPDGAIIHFPNSARDYMKVCDKNGVDGVVALDNGMYVKAHDLSYLGLSADSVEIVYKREDFCFSFEEPPYYGQSIFELNP